MIKIVNNLPTLRSRYSTSYGIPIWRSRISGKYFCRICRGVVLCADSSDYEVLLERVHLYLYMHH